MNSAPCEREEQLLEMIRQRSWPEAAPSELREHVAACASCAELALVAGYLLQVAKTAEGEAALPEAGFVWWKARLLARRAAAERAVRPVVIAERVGAVAGAVAVAGFLAWQWPLIKEWLGPQHFPFSSHPGTWISLFAASLVSTLVLAGVGFYLLLWSEK